MRHTWAKPLQKHFPAYFFDAPYHSIKFHPDWSTLNFFYSNGPPFACFQPWVKMQKSCIFCFLRFSKNFFAQNDYLCPRNNSRPFPQLCACFLWRKSHFDARAFCGHRQPPGVKKVNFPKKIPFWKSPKIFYFLYPRTSLILCYFIRFFVEAGLKHPGPGFVFGENSANSSTKKITFLEKTPLRKSPKISYFLYPQTSLILFCFIRFFVEASFEGSGSGVVFAKVAKVVIIQRLLCVRCMKNLCF